MNKIMRFGSLFFTIVLFSYSVFRHSLGKGNSYIFYMIAAVGFLIMFISYSRKK